MTIQEQGLEIKLKELQEMNKYIALSLFPPTGSTIIEKDNNRARINEGRLGKFDNITEKFYDQMVELYDSRYKTKTQ